jgi:iron complex outermembrane recepter protein
VVPNLGNQAVLNWEILHLNIELANPRQVSIAVRGLGNNPANDGFESSVGVYLDDVYLGRPGMASQDLVDIEQISLLRGPQGTLFGKNTTAGGRGSNMGQRSPNR